LQQQAILQQQSNYYLEFDITKLPEQWNESDGKGGHSFKANITITN